MNEQIQGRVRAGGRRNEIFTYGLFAEEMHSASLHVLQ